MQLVRVLGRGCAVAVGALVASGTVVAQVNVFSITYQLGTDGVFLQDEVGSSLQLGVIAPFEEDAWSVDPVPSTGLPVRESVSDTTSIVGYSSGDRPDFPTSPLIGSFSVGTAFVSGDSTIGLGVPAFGGDNVLDPVPFAPSTAWPGERAVWIGQVVSTGSLTTFGDGLDLVLSRSDGGSPDFIFDVGFFEPFVQFAGDPELEATYEFRWTRERNSEGNWLYQMYVVEIPTPGVGVIGLAGAGLLASRRRR